MSLNQQIMLWCSVYTIIVVKEQLLFMKEDLLGKAEASYYRNSCPVLALDEYKKDKGEDKFSRKQVWFYVYGDDELEEFFIEELTEMIEDRFIDDKIDWDLMTLYPTHVQNEVNPHMQSLLRKVSARLGIDYEQILVRTQTIEENHELEQTKAKVINLEGSIDVKDFSEKNIILIDNISLTGTSMLHGADKLIKKGAKNVFGVCLGIGQDFPNKKHVTRGKKASELVE